MSTPTEAIPPPRAVELRIWAALALLWPAGALCEDLTFSISAPLEGYYRQGGLLELRLDIENRGDDLEAEVKIGLAHGTVTATVSLPAPSRKTLSVPLVIPDRRHSLEAVLWSEGQALARRRVDLRPLTDSEQLTLAVGREAPSDLPRGDAPGSRVLTVEAERLPRAWYGYGPTSVVQLGPKGPAALDEDQRKALRAWVASGGTVSLPENPDGPLPVGSKRAGDASTAHSLWALDREVLESLAGHGDDRSRFRVGVLLALYCLVCTVALGRPPGSSYLPRGLLLAGVILVFTVFGTSIGRLAVADQDRLRESSIVHVFPSTDTILTSSRIDLISRGIGLERIAASSPAAVLEPATDATPVSWSLPEAGPATLLVPSWALSRTSLFARSATGGDAMFEAQDAGTLRNRSGSDLGPCAMVETGEVTEIADLPSGMTFELSHRLSGVETRGAVGSERRSTLLEAVLERYRPWHASGSGRLLACETMNDGTTRIDGTPGRVHSAVLLIHSEATL